jgi:hypothetical protein
LAAVLAQNVASAGVPTAVVYSTTKAATRFAAGQVAAAGAIPLKVTALTEGVLKAMFVNKLMKVTAALLLLATAVAGVCFGAWTSQTQAAQPDKQAEPSKTLPLDLGTLGHFPPGFFDPGSRAREKSEPTPLPEDGKWELRRDFKLDGKVEEAQDNTTLQLKRKGNQISGHFVDKKANGKDNDSTFSGEVIPPYSEEVITHGKPLLILRQEHKDWDGDVVVHTGVIIHTGQLVGENHYRGVWYDNSGHSGDFELKHSK